jgi:hypothetical protein
MFPFGTATGGGMDSKRFLELFGGDEAEADKALFDGRVTRAEGVNGQTHKREAIPLDVVLAGAFSRSYARGVVTTSGTPPHFAAGGWYDLRVFFKAAKPAAEDFRKAYFAKAKGRVKRKDFISACCNATGASFRMAEAEWRKRPEIFVKVGAPKKT